MTTVDVRNGQQWRRREWLLPVAPEPAAQEVGATRSLVEAEWEPILIRPYVRALQHPQSARAARILRSTAPVATGPAPRAAELRREQHRPVPGWPADFRSGELRPELSGPEPLGPGLFRTERPRPATAARPGPTPPAPNRTATRSGAGQAGTSRSEASRSGAGQAGASRSEASRSGAGRGDASRSRATRAEAARARAGRSEAGRAGVTRPGGAGPGGREALGPEVFGAGYSGRHSTMPVDERLPGVPATHQAPVERGRRRFVAVSSGMLMLALGSTVLALSSARPTPAPPTVGVTSPIRGQFETAAAPAPSPAASAAAPSPATTDPAAADLAAALPASPGPAAQVPVARSGVRSRTK